MAKRKRLTPANPVFLEEPAAPSARGPLATPPIAGVASEASATAALSEVAETLTRAREEGRMVLSLPLEQVALNHLIRDRIALDEGEMQTLMASLRARGQQTPVEVVSLGADRYGLISGWRRCQALLRLFQETGETRFATVQALLRTPEEASDAYLAMVEENEIRVGLSYFERARIAAQAVAQGVYPTPKAALQNLFHAASPAKRSKIGSFLPIVAALEGALRFPEALSERLGLQLSRALEDLPGLDARLRTALKAAAPATPEDEIAVIEAAMAAPAPVPDRPASLVSRIARGETSPKQGAKPQPAPVKDPVSEPVIRPLAPGFAAIGSGSAWRQNSDGSVTLQGVAARPETRAALLAWLKAHG